MLFYRKNFNPVFQKFKFEDSQAYDRLALFNVTLFQANGYAKKGYILKQIFK